MLVRKRVPANDEYRVGFPKECPETIDHRQKRHPAALVVLEVRWIDQELLFARRIAAENRCIIAFNPVDGTVQFPKPRPPHWQRIVFYGSEVEKRFTCPDEPVEKRYFEEFECFFEQKIIIGREYFDGTDAIRSTNPVGETVIAIGVFRQPPPNGCGDQPPNSFIEFRQSFSGHPINLFSTFQSTNGAKLRQNMLNVRNRCFVARACIGQLVPTFLNSASPSSPAPTATVKLA